MNSIRQYLVFLSSLLLVGCASWTNYTAPVDLRNGSISIDVKQRIVFSQKTRSGEVVVCAEPSPDALTVIGASGVLSPTEN